MKWLNELVYAMQRGEVGNVTAFLDNDQVVFYGGEKGETRLLELHPTELQEQALTALGIHWEHV